MSKVGIPNRKYQQDFHNTKNDEKADPENSAQGQKKSTMYLRKNEYL